MQAKMVRTITAADEVRAIDTIVMAFAADPIARWCWPDSHQYLTSMPDFTRAFGGGAFLHNGAHSSDDYAAAAFWLPPNVHSEEEGLGEIVERTVSASTRGDLFGVLEQMAAANHVEKQQAMLGSPSYTRGFESRLVERREFHEQGCANEEAGSTGHVSDHGGWRRYTLFVCLRTRKLTSSLAEKDSGCGLTMDRILDCELADMPTAHV